MESGKPGQGTLLVVDDSEMNRDMLSRRLARKGYAVMTAESGQQALDLVAAQCPDAVLLDIMMPGMDGMEVLSRLRAQHSATDLPVIMVTAKDASEDVAKALQAGANDYVTKPIDFTVLLARTTAALQVKHAQQELKKQMAEVQRLAAELAAAHQQVQELNARLQEENQRMAAELDVARRIQAMVLPTPEELAQVAELDIAARMVPADEVGGDYYDVLQSGGALKIGIGDVTGHGVESGVLMLMVQTAVRTLLTAGMTDPVRFLGTLGRVLFDNLARAKMDRGLSLALLDYRHGELRISGQHEEVILVRSHGAVERVDTLNLGCTLGLQRDMDEFFASTTVALQPGDVVVLYTDGIVEAESPEHRSYGLERLCQVVQAARGLPSAGIRDAIVEDVFRHMGPHTMYDDVTVVVLKQQAPPAAGPAPARSA